MKLKELYEQGEYEEDNVNPWEDEYHARDTADTDTTTKELPEDLVSQYESRARSEMEAGGTIDIDHMLPTIAIVMSDGSKYFFQEHEAEEILSQIPDNIADEDFLLAQAQNW